MINKKKKTKKSDNSLPPIKEQNPIVSRGNNNSHILMVPPTKQLVDSESLPTPLKNTPRRDKPIWTKKTND